MKTTKQKAKAGSPVNKKVPAAQRPIGAKAPKKLSAFELETITVSLELAEEHFAKAAAKWPEGNQLRQLHEAFGISAKKLLDLIRDGQFSLDLEGAL